MIVNKQPRDPPLPKTRDVVRVLLVVEGVNDIEFLRRISVILHAADSTLPHLADMEQQGELVFVPFGGGNVSAWTHRLAPLDKPEFHLVDHERPPETEYRKDAVQQVNRRHNCKAVLTQKRSIENYLHPQAISAAGGMDVDFNDFESVADIIAKHRYHLDEVDTPWELLSRRARGRMTNRAKHWLNTRAAEHMTVDLLRERDPNGEVISWLRSISRLADCG